MYVVNIVLESVRPDRVLRTCPHRKTSFIMLRAIDMADIIVKYYFHVNLTDIFLKTYRLITVGILYIYIKKILWFNIEISHKIKKRNFIQQFT